MASISAPKIIETLVGFHDMIGDVSRTITRMSKPNSSLRINLSAVVYQEGNAWIAHCLELDIVSEGTSRDDALEGLVSLCDFQIKVALKEGDLRSIFRPAPPETWQMFASARQRTVTEGKAIRRKKGFETPVERFETRELVPA